MAAARVLAGKAAPALATFPTLAVSVPVQSALKPPGAHAHVAEELIAEFPTVLEKLALPTPLFLAMLKYPAVGILITAPPGLPVFQKPSG